MNKKNLVTDNAGFIGYPLCKELLDSENEVICVNKFFMGNKSNIMHHPGSTPSESIKHDVTSPFYIEADEIYNFACPASSAYYPKDPVQTTKTLVHGAINSLGFGQMSKSKTSQTSSSEVYDYPNHRKLVITLAKNHLQWESTVPLEAGLQETTVYFKRII